MFVVFGVNPAVEMPRLREKLPDASEAALMAGVRMCKAKAVQEYDNRDVAYRYRDMLIKAGWVNCDVRCQILKSPTKDGGMPGKRGISAADLDGVDVREQELLHGWKDGSRFAPTLL